MPCPELSCRCSLLLLSVYCNRACPCRCRSAPSRRGSNTRRDVLRRVCLYAVSERCTSMPARVRSRSLIVVLALAGAGASVLYKEARMRRSSWTACDSGLPLPPSLVDEDTRPCQGYVCDLHVQTYSGARARTVHHHTWHRVIIQAEAEAEAEAEAQAQAQAQSSLNRAQERGPYNRQ
jgi:hypothetical protein